MCVCVCLSFSVSICMSISVFFCVRVLWGGVALLGSVLPFYPVGSRHGAQIPRNKHPTCDEPQVKNV